MSKVILLIGLLVCGLWQAGHAQEELSSIKVTHVFGWDQLPVPIDLPALKAAIGYPAIAVQAKIEGTVLVRALVDEQGNCVKAVVVKDPHPILTRAVTAQLHLLRFTPCMEGGVPQKVEVDVPFEFILGNPEDRPLPKGTQTKFRSVAEALAAPNSYQVRELDLSGQGLKQVPEEVLGFCKLEKLVLTDNQLSDLPPGFERLENLKVLILNDNSFKRLNPTVLGMPGLRQVHISNNLMDSKEKKALEKVFGGKLYPKDARGHVVW